MNGTESQFFYIRNRQFAWYYALFLFLTIFYSCNSPSAPKDTQLVNNPAQMDEKVTQNIKDMLDFALANKGNINDTMKLYLPAAVSSFYKENDYKNVWSSKEEWKPNADSIYRLVENAQLYGLFPEDYHFADLKQLREKLKDSLQKTDAVLWSRSDLLLTDGFMKILKHVKEGRLLPDSISLSSDTSMTTAFFVKHTMQVRDSVSVTSLIQKLEPKHYGYHALKQAIPKFLDSMDRKKYTYVVYPNKDSIALVKSVQKRLSESGYIPMAGKTPDSATLANALKKFQKDKKLTADGKLGAATVRAMNTSDLERFKRIAITLDRYKQLPAQLPAKYLWVNLPGYYLHLRVNDSIEFESRVIVGKPHTRTPTLNSEISDMITYPQWTIPASIIKKEVLPGLKRNPGYLTRRGYSLVDSKGNTVDPYSINWAKYTTGIPYKVVQGSGDDNALGVLKFNFNNPYSVYLHDTNQRYLFKNKERALSHGCVRVQEWEKLAFYIARNDSINKKRGDTLRYNVDSLKTWLSQKVRKRVLVKNRIPLYIRYFTCEGKNDQVIFYDDIYGEDKKLRDQYFNKQ